MEAWADHGGSEKQADARLLRPTQTQTSQPGQPSAQREIAMTDSQPDQLSTDENTFYRVELTATGQPACQCANCQLWTVAYDDGEPTEIGTSWEGDDGKEAAQDVCDLMNMAFAAGLEHKHRYVKEPAAPIGYACACGEHPPVGWYPESPDV
jgi:hypothetical protein